MMTLSKNSEQRISPRKKLKTRVIFEDEFSEDFLYFLSTDISLSGIFIESTMPLQNHTKVFLKFSLYEGDPPIEVTGEVTRLLDKKRGRGRRKKDERTGIGLRFLGLESRDLSRIEAFIGA